MINVIMKLTNYLWFDRVELLKIQTLENIIGTILFKIIISSLENIVPTSN